MKNEFLIKDKKVGKNSPVYFIADIAANHDGDLQRAKDLIYMVAEAGGDAAKFQNFTANKIVSDRGFKDLGGQKSHQAQWEKSVFDVYQDASLSWDWTAELKECCDKANIHYFSSPYDFGAVDMLESYVPAYKIGSGDITWLEIVEHIAKKKKPVLIAAGASTWTDVENAVNVIREYHDEIALMQCNTNYTASLENFKYIQLNVLKHFAKAYPDIVLGLSDHTPGHATVLGSVALGAKVIEKHFTDDTTRVGPDHKFSMDPKSWKEMVLRTRELELALGSEEKKVEANEAETVILQRRSVRAARDLAKGAQLQSDDIECLRPCPNDAIPANAFQSVVGCTLQQDIKFGQHLTEGMIKR